MKSIKPGRGPSAMGFMGSVISVAFGIFWTIMATSMTRGIPIVGVFFPLFGVLFIIMGIVNALYNYKNATSKNRFSTFDITDSTEESDPLEQIINKNNNISDKPSATKKDFDESLKFCPYCGSPAEQEHDFCAKCGKEL